MKRFFNKAGHHLDFHLLLVWLFSVPAILPLVQPFLTHSADGLLHLYRVVALAQAISQPGVLFPRWLPDLAYGYGFPLFVYYAPLSYYLTLFLSLAGLRTVFALNAAFILALLLAGTGTYLFVKVLFGPKAGLLAGVAYVYAPFQILNTLSRGGLPAAWAMALFSLVFWAFARLTRQLDLGLPTSKKLVYIALSAFILGLALLTHNTLSLLFVPLVGLYVGLELLVRFFQFPMKPSLSGFIPGVWRGKESGGTPPTPTCVNLSNLVRDKPSQRRFYPPQSPLLGGKKAPPPSRGRLGGGRIAANTQPQTLKLTHKPPTPPPPSAAPASATRWQLIWPVGLAMIMGFGLAAFFLIPAILEKEYAQVHRVIISPDFDFRFNFVAFNQLFSLPPPAYIGQLNPNVPLTLGLAQVGLAVTGLTSLLVCYLRHVKNTASIHCTYNGTRLLPVIAFATLALAGIIFMMLPISVDVWDQIPLLAFVQFPHRLLGPAALVLALLAGAGVAMLPNRWAFSVTVIGIILIIGTAIPLLYPRYRDPLPNEPTILDMMAYEHSSGVIGTTSFGEYLPIWVKTIPYESPLESMYQAGVAIKRLNPAFLPPDAIIESASYAFNRADIVINSAESFQAIFNTFYFPGWKATIDGQPALINPVSDRGLIGIKMPAGQHHLQLSFQETPLRKMANTFSAIILVLTLGLLIAGAIPNIRQKRSPKYTLDSFSNPTSTMTSGLNRRQLLTLAGIGIIIIVSKLYYLDRVDNPLKRTFNGTNVAGTDASMQINFGEQINLLGYDLDQSALKPGQHFNLTLYWQARQPLPNSYSALAQLIDADRRLYGGQDNLHPGSLPATEWQPWGFVQDPHAILIPPGTPPGDYYLATGLYEPTTWVRLPVLSNEEFAWNDVVAIPVTVTKPANPPAVTDLDIRWPVEAKINADLQLLGATPERDVIRRNDFLRIALYWEALGKPTDNYKIKLRLLTTEGKVIWDEISQPSYNRYPTTLWTAGERVRDNHAVWISADFPSGVYQVQLQVLNGAGHVIGDWIELGLVRTEE